MKKTIFKAISFFIVAVLLLGTVSVYSFATSSFTVENGQLKNEYLSLSVSEESGRFTIGTAAGNPDSDTDNDKKMLFGWPSTGTSFTTIVVDGKEYIYGNNGFSQSPKFNTNQGNNISIVNYGDVEVKQTLQIINNNSTDRDDVVEIKYEITNKGSSSHNIGTRIMLDTMLGDNDDAPFRVSGIGAVTTQTEFKDNSIPQYWQAFDSLTEPKVVAQGSFLRSGQNAPDKVQFTNWGKVYDDIWNCPVTSGISNGDSAVTVTWNEKAINAGETKTYITHYGLSELVQDVQPPLAISLYGDSTVSIVDGKYTPDTVNVTAYIQNIGNGVAKNAYILITSTGSGLELEGNSDYEKVELGNIAPGQEKQISWDLKVNNVSQDTVEVIIISVGADNFEEKRLTKYINIPAIGKDNRIKWGKENIFGNWTGEDNLSFINAKDNFINKSWGNYIEDNYHISDEYFNLLVEGMENTVVENINSNRYPESGWGGSCYGMSCVVSLMKDGRLSPSYWKPGGWLSSAAQNTHDLKSPIKDKSTENLINFYHLSQCLPDIVELQNTFFNTNQTEDPSLILQQVVAECKKVKNGGLPVLISYWWMKNELDADGNRKSAGHTIVGYDVDEGTYTVGTDTFKYRISVCDPNKTKWSYLYINENYSDWKYDGLKTNAEDNSSGSVWVENNVEQKWIARVQAEINTIDIVNPETKVNRTRLKKFNSNFIQSTTCSFEVTDLKGNILDVDNIILDDGTKKTFLPDGDFMIKPQKTNGFMNLSIMLKECSASVDATGTESLTITQDGELAFNGKSSDCSLKMTLNSSLSEMPWYTVQLNGENIDNYKMQACDDGVLVSGNNLTQTTVIANNRDSAVTLDVVSEQESVLLKEGNNGKMEAYEDTDSNGTYETKIAESVEYTQNNNTSFFERLLAFFRSIIETIKSIFGIN